jgi:Galactose oxidase, central domain
MMRRLRSLVVFVTVVAAAASGCAPGRRTIEVLPALDVASCLGGRVVSELRLAGLGDFPPDPSQVATAAPGQPVTLALARGTRVLDVEGFGPAGLAAFGRSATIDPDQVSSPLAIAYGPPDALCATAKMRFARSGHHATRLASGAVVISGGVDAANGPVQRLELYRPTGGPGAPVPAFDVVDQNGATLLAPGAVLGHAVAPLAAGGFLVIGGAGALPSSGRANGIASQGFTEHDGDGLALGGPRLLGGARAFHSATVLAGGRVLVAGGCTELDDGDCAAGHALATTELYDPATGAFTAGPALKFARWDHDAVLLGDGSVLLVGGRGEPPDPAPPLEVFDPTEERPFAVGAAGGRAARLPTGGVLVAGGGRANADAAVALWLPGATTPAPLASLPVAAAGHTVTPLDDGAVLIAGGESAAGFAPLTVLDGAGGVRAVGAFGARDHSATRLADGTVLLAGGTDATGAARADAFVYLRSPLGPYSSLPALTLDGPDAPVAPRRPGGVVVGSGQLAITAGPPEASGRPGDVALVRALVLGDASVQVSAGRRGAGAGALVVGWASDASFAFVTLDVGRPVTLSHASAPRPGQVVIAPDAACVGAVLDDAELPDGDAAPLTLSLRLGALSVATAARTLLDCAPAAAIDRGAVGFAALRGTVVFQSITITR